MRKTTMTLKNIHQASSRSQGRPFFLQSFLPKPIVLVLSGALLISACANSPKSPSGAVAARERLTQLQNDPELAGRASIAIDNADKAVRAAEKPVKDKALSNHLVHLATTEVEVAWAQATTRKLEEDRKKIAERRDLERLESRTREVESLRRELAELNAKKTDRGMVVTLGDMLFETGKSQLKGNAFANLSRLSTFLTNNPDRTLTIEGHTDNVGSETSNEALSQRRADAVRQYLIQQGISPQRLTAYGKGENFPVASNDTPSGRALNRRVEVIIADPAPTAGTR
mgnify:CR=1 FL=1